MFIIYSLKYTSAIFLPAQMLTASPFASAIADCRGELLGLKSKIDHISMGIIKTGLYSIIQGGIIFYPDLSTKIMAG